MSADDWRFHADRISQHRLAVLTSRIPFGVIVEKIAEGMMVEFVPEKGKEKAKGKVRARFYLANIGCDAYDLFFNSTSGIRAHYYVSPAHGDTQNRLAIDQLRQSLIEKAWATPQNTMSIAQVERSLDCPSAKIWIDEGVSTLDRTSRDLDKVLLIRAPRWLAAIENVQAIWRSSNPSDPAGKLQARAFWGVQAPEGNRLKVLGAWLGDNDEEYVVPCKRDRADQIHHYGFS